MSLIRPLRVPRVLFSESRDPEVPTLESEIPRYDHKNPDIQIFRLPQFEHRH